MESEEMVSILLTYYDKFNTDTLSESSGYEFVSDQMWRLVTRIENERPRED